MAEQSIPIPNDALPEFDELYSISDLHLGGLPGFQIFDSGKELAWLIDHLRTMDPARRIALVINGDFVDFLAEEPTRHFDPLNAVRKLDRIVSDPAFSDVWKALKEFVKAPQRTLFVNLGNHDLELALPWVRHRLLDILSDGNPSARGRVVLSFEGAGVLCRVGTARALCVHGNEVDDWNLADYEKLRRMGRDIAQGRPVTDWQPNAGSKMVIEVMNDLKQRYPFIDLLKPETDGLIPTLLALVPEKRAKFDDLLRVASRLGQDKVRRSFGLLSGELAGDLDDDTGLTSPIKPMTRASAKEFTQDLQANLLRETEKRIDDGTDPLDLINLDPEDQLLGKSSALFRRMIGQTGAEVLRDALEKLQQDRNFEFSFRDKDTFQRIDDLIGGSIDFLITGHTHLERALPRNRGGYYFNSGTWARLIRFEKDLLTDPVGFAAVFERLRNGTMKDLDDFKYVLNGASKDLVLRRLTVVAVWTQDNKTLGELRRVEFSATSQRLQPVAGTLFPKG